MKIKLDWRKTAQENASDCYRLSKEFASKAEGARKAIKETEAALQAAREESETVAKAEAEKKPSMKRKKELYEKYKWFFTSGGKLVVAGRDAKQNDMLVAKFMDEDDLFFHADIQGAPATILKGGKSANEQEKKEAAQFAASHSSAWKVGAAAVDVYAVEKGQLSKHAQGGFVGAGGFAISGKREWFHSTKLGLAIGMQDGMLICLPKEHPNSGKLEFSLEIGKTEKGEATKIIVKKTGANADEVLLALPSGEFSITGKDYVPKNRS